jgi:surface antigen
MDITDRMNTSAALENVQTGVPTTWQNPDTCNQYTVVPTKTYETGTGPCREYTINAMVGAEENRSMGPPAGNPMAAGKFRAY